MQINFTKMQGCGNDYVYINGFTEIIPQQQKPDFVRKMSDRHFGIGGDGVIFVNPSQTADFEWRCIMRTEPVRKCAGMVSAVWENLYMTRG